VIGEVTRRRWRTRFAPAPTGFLHLGHVANAIHVWGIARAFGGEVLLRIEDHDRGRCRPEFERALLDDLDWLGFAPDIHDTASFRTGTPHVARQSDNGARYARALATLADVHQVYPCRCSRKEIAAASMRNGAVLPASAEFEELHYPGTCRTAQRPADDTAARRVWMPDVIESFVDLRHGPLEQRPALQCGDLLLRDRHDNWTYHCAVVTDDLAHGVDVIVRGDDLLESTGRQRWLRRALGGDTEPVTYHHALVRDPGGRKLSKSARDTPLSAWREGATDPALLIGHVAQRVGLQRDSRPCAAADVARWFAHDTWLGAAIAAARASRTDRANAE
jgi:glutamyl-tRNA synthetase/glutamyl-Q tRNA(Asp) synthetase